MHPENVQCGEGAAAQVDPRFYFGDSPQLQLWNGHPAVKQLHLEEDIQYEQWRLEANAEAAGFEVIVDAGGERAVERAEAGVETETAVVEEAEAAVVEEAEAAVVETKAEAAVSMEAEAAVEEMEVETEVEEKPDAAVEADAQAAQNAKAAWSEAPMEADAQLVRTSPSAGDSGAVQQQAAATLLISSITDNEAEHLNAQEMEVFATDDLAQMNTMLTATQEEMLGSKGKKKKQLKKKQQAMDEIVGRRSREEAAVVAQWEAETAAALAVLALAKTHAAVPHLEQVNHPFNH